MSYRVLTDGNGGPVIRVVGLGDFIRFEAHNAALVAANAERDALVSLMETLRQADRDYKDNNILRYEFTSKVMAAINSTPQQCLANVRAAAIENAGNALYNAGVADASASDWLVLHAAKVRGGKA